MRTLYNSKDFLTKSLGMSPKLFCAMMDDVPLALLKYHMKDERSQKYLSFHSPYLAMSELDTSVASLGDTAPDPNIFYCMNKATLAHLIQHMMFVLTMNNYFCAEDMPASCLKAPNTPFMMWYNKDGTELSTMENPLTSPKSTMLVSNVFILTIC